MMHDLLNLMNVEAKEYILNDYNPDLVNFFTYVMSRPNDIILYVKPYFEDMNSEKYYDVREKFNTLSKTSFERASLFLVLKMILYQYHKKFQIMVNQLHIL